MSFTLEPILLPVWVSVHVHVSLCVLRAGFGLRPATSEYCFWNTMAMTCYTAADKHAHTVHTLSPVSVDFFLGRDLSGCKGSSLELNSIKDFFLLSFIHGFFFASLLPGMTTAFWQHEEMLKGLWVCLSVNICLCTSAISFESVCVCVFTNSHRHHLLRICKCHHSKAERQENNL